MRIRRAAVVAILASVLAACAGPVPTPPASPAPSPSPTLRPSPSATLAAAIPIDVRFRGGLNCNLGFSYACSPFLSILEPASAVPDSFRPAETDPWWDPRAGTFEEVRPRDWTLGRGTLATSPGRHLLVISLIGASDVASFNPDGSVATELLARCTAEVDVAPDAQSVDLVVRFEPDPETTIATCTIDAGGP